jgi:hypothetical protein
LQHWELKIMKTSGKKSEKQSKNLKKNAKRLAAYSAAAAATVVTVGDRTANATDQSFNIVDISTSGGDSVSLFLTSGAIGYDQYDSGWGNSSEGNFLITDYWMYAPLVDPTAAFADPCTLGTDCGTGIGPGADVPGNEDALSVFPLPITGPSVNAGMSFAARSYNAALSGFGNYAAPYYFKVPEASNAIVGVRFTLSGASHYGWIALSAEAGGDFLVHGFGYNDVAGDPSMPNLDTVDVPGDANRDGLLNSTDWDLVRDNLGANHDGLTREEAYKLGDLTHDGFGDIRDFDEFREAYEAANGLGSFATMVAASTVPEPSSILLLAAGAAGLGMWRKKKTS